jgi:hypothetical protein
MKETIKFLLHRIEALTIELEKKNNLLNGYQAVNKELNKQLNVNRKLKTNRG